MRSIWIVVMPLLVALVLVAVNRNQFYSERQTMILCEFLQIVHVLLQCRRSSVALHRKSLQQALDCHEH